MDAASGGPHDRDMESKDPSIPAHYQTAISIQDSDKNSFLKNILIGMDGLRSGWRVLLFYSCLAVVIFSLIAVIRAVIRALWTLPPIQSTTFVTPGRGLLNEAVVLMGVLLTSAMFARFERHSFAVYGLPFRGAFGGKFWEGILWGLVLMSFVLFVLRATGNFYFGVVTLSLRQAAAFAGLWAVYFIMVGVAEEFAFRGYPLFALTRGLGFRPAAALLAFLFGTVHLANARENWLGAVSIVVVGLLLAFTLRRTGSLWFAIGMHASWDWAQSFLYGVPDSGVSFAGHLLSPSLQGSKWMTGGSVGPEASIVTLLGYILVFVLIGFRFPKRAIQ